MNYELAFYFIIGLNVGFLIKLALDKVIYYQKKKDLEESQENFKKSFKELKRSLSDLKSLDSSIPPKLPPEAVNDMSAIPQGVLERLEKITRLSEESSYLAASINEPQRSALDGRDKQRNAGRFKMLQEEIAQNMKDILNMGYDLNVMTIDMDTGKKKAEKLSNIIKHIEGKLGGSDKPGPNLSLIRPEKENDGNDDGGNDPTKH